MKVYFISGLAADKRVFQNIILPSGFHPVYLDWISPNKYESLESYAHRLAEKIDLKERFSIIGVSMGGMIASEIAKKHLPVSTILISSAATCKQFPTIFTIAYFFRIHKIVPTSLLKSASILKRFFSAEDPQHKLILKQVIKESDPHFIRWAINAILQWKNEDIPERLWHIHGTKDRVLPIGKTRPTHVIIDADHLMVMSRAGELNQIIESILKVH